MSNPIPDLLALTSIADGSQRLAAPIRNNFSAVQAAENELIAALSGGSAGQVIDAVDSTHVQWAYPPGYEYGYTAFTSSVNVTATTEATATTIVTALAVTFDGATDVWIEFFTSEMYTGAGGAITAVLYDGVASIGMLATVGGPTMGAPALLRRKLTPAAATKTYSIRAFVASGTGQMVAGLGGNGLNMPGYIRITKA